MGPGGPFGSSPWRAEPSILPENPLKTKEVLWGGGLTACTIRLLHPVCTILNQRALVFHPIPRPEELLNRELSWLDFNARVMEEAEDPTVPLLERVKFLSIVSSNWDEFFMVRVAGIWRQIDAGITQPGPDGLTPRQLLERVSSKIHAYSARQHELFHTILEPQLEAEGIAIMDPKNLDESQAAFLLDYFERSLLPLITPLAVDTGHPFPRLGNRALVLVVELEPDEDLLDGDLPASELSFIHVPTGLASRFLRVPSAPGTHAFVMLEDVVRHHLSRLFLGYTVKSCHAIRVTRGLGPAGGGRSLRRPSQDRGREPPGPPPRCRRPPPV